MTTILGISGSLRKGSYNTGLLRAAAQLAPKGVTISTFDIRDIPAYDGDLHAKGNPESVEKLRQAIAAADGILFASPEYNYSIPGVLKNAIDWASRPPSQPFAGKPFAIMGASGGMGGTMRMQYHLRQVAVFLDMQAVNRPECFVRNAGSLFDAEANLTDDPTKKVVTELLEALVKSINARR